MQEIRKIDIKSTDFSGPVNPNSPFRLTESTQLVDSDLIGKRIDETVLQMPYLEPLLREKFFSGQNLLDYLKTSVKFARLIRGLEGYVVLATSEQERLLYHCVNWAKNSTNSVCDAEAIVRQQKFNWNRIHSGALQGRSIWTNTEPVYGSERPILEIGIKGRILDDTSWNFRNPVIQFIRGLPLKCTEVSVDIQVKLEEFVYDFVIRYFDIDAISRGQEVEIKWNKPICGIHKHQPDKSNF